MHMLLLSRGSTSGFVLGNDHIDFKIVTSIRIQITNKRASLAHLF